jgi:hypothetical protein
LANRVKCEISGLGAATVVPRWCYGEAPMWIGQPTDIEGLTKVVRSGLMQVASL